MTPRTKALNARRRRVRKGTARVSNSTVRSRGGQSGPQDLGSYYRTNQHSSHPLDIYPSSWQRAQEYAGLYYKEWAAQKIIDIPVNDMLRNGWTYKGLTDDQAKKLKAAEKRMKFREKLRTALTMERLVGGAVMLYGVRGTESTEAEDPLMPRDIHKGDVTFINVIPRTRLKRLNWEQNPFNSEYGAPNKYSVHGVTVHTSRLAILDGRPISPNASYDFGLRFLDSDGFGQSVLGPIWHDLVRATGTRQAAYHLIHRASVLIVKAKDAASALGTKQGSKVLEELDEIADQLSMYQAAKVTGKDVDVDQWSATFSSVPELMITFLQIISAASDIPATRFLGQAPGGLNATGESDLENYYDMIECAREDRVEPAIRRNLELMGRSVLGPEFNPDDVEIEFQPLWNSSAKEDAETRAANGPAIRALWEDGLIDDKGYFAEAKRLGIVDKDREMAKRSPIEPTPQEAPVKPFEDTVSRIGAVA